MILKCKDNKNWVYLDNVNEMKVILREKKDILCETNTEFTMIYFLKRILESYDLENSKYVFVADNYTSDWLKVVITNDNKYIITNQDLFLLNDKGQTIERIV